jgi:hypothetical protein
MKTFSEKEASLHAAYPSTNRLTIVMIVTDLGAFDEPGTSLARRAHISHGIELDPFRNRTLRVEVDSSQVFLHRPLIEEHRLLVRMEFSADHHHTLFHIDDSLHHISELPIRHVVQLVPGHDISNYFDVHSIGISALGVSACMHDYGLRSVLSIEIS